eukprot:CAMPEP_0195120552 /NCGR_PEP_ID=MMETSP0448-20130528/122091_1 /TAXON_ID=66468 /ORGANISM="Heterocapsa triquestra, Strain CCMP 448" /LENGTH=431 /DNA_ID=CAMNT_0040157979 /DNA_START=51 /DNA_END=1341 /DNA_ORIENTATION=+
MGGGASTQQKYKDPETQCLALQRMRPDYKGPTLLSADVGGTSSRLHLFLPPDEGGAEAEELVPPERKIHTAKYSNSKYDSFADIIRAFLEDAGLDKPPDYACLAMAGTIVDNRVQFINLGWTVDGALIEKEFKIRKVVLINDFVAQGYGCLTLDTDKDCEVLQAAPVREGAPMAVVGAGTGLGEAFLTTGFNGDYDVWPTEGGHAEFAPRASGSSNLEFEMVQYLQIKYSAKARVSIERVVSGRGLGNIYEFLAWKFPEKINKQVHRAFIGPVEGPRLFDPAAITMAAARGDCVLSKWAVELFCSAYGSEVGCVGLTYMPFGGLFVTGGVTHKLREFIKGKKGGPVNHFMEAFYDKGRVTPMLMKVPVFLVRGEDLGERGAMLKAQRLFLEDKAAQKEELRAPGGPLGGLRLSAQAAAPPFPLLALLSRPS